MFDSTKNHWSKCLLEVFVRCTRSLWISTAASNGKGQQLVAKLAHSLSASTARIHYRDLVKLTRQPRAVWCRPFLTYDVAFGRKFNVKTC